MDLETKHYTDGSSACGPGPLPDHSPEQQERAKLVAAILTENGHPVSSPDEGDLDDVERERWNVCVEIVRRLDAATKHCNICGGRVDLTSAAKPTVAFR